MSFGKGFRFGAGNALGNLTVVMIVVAVLGVGVVGGYWYIKHSAKQAVMRPVNAVKHGAEVAKDKAAEVGEKALEKAAAAKKAVTDKAHDLGDKTGAVIEAGKEKAKSWKFWGKDKQAEPAKQE